MNTTNQHIFDQTMQKTNLWLSDLMSDLDWQDRHKAYLALRAVLHTLRDRLTVEEVAHLGAQLPMLIRGLYYEGWNPSKKQVKERHQEEFLAHVRSYFKADDRVVPEKVVRAVFRLLSMRVTKGEIQDIKQILPSELRLLWP
jgi:uncharacterized protein (DUF2267 family)